ncbi:HAMP domain-containing histidine kinase [Alicyclobacillus cycloheptanicus]|uniref:histidine kinase n=1 Tax=Alicyclobacillus cycloheptanicus TaxID=1457 RepID=A0ABT9XEA3_9BACL|nr:HAMP domain-containing sensor histidine kinase [Alicyclobacillus cycloheptanicus]MDQ0188636.1 two-component system sensor histidine kinase ArlS [Alicyclobacillus cycloheptanicus]WDM00688.1 HAMP domain-containing histidine kinase [Alicyclobacillus cycloheptanicus]
MKTRVTVLTSVVLCVILLVLDGFIYLTLHVRLMKIEEAAVLSKAQSIAQSMTNAPLSQQPFLFTNRTSSPTSPDDLTDHRTWLRQYGAFGQEILIVTTNHQVLAQIGRGDPNALLTEFASLQHPGDQTVHQLPNSTLFVSVPYYSTNGHSVTGYVLLESDISQVTTYMHNLLVLLLSGSVGAVLLAALGGYVVSAFAVRPINQMIRTVQRIQFGHLNERVAEPRGRDEVARLASTFNQMLTRMERSFEQQTRFVTDASHEILTPLTTIQGYVNLLDRWGKDSPEVLEKAIRALQNESTRLQELADDLLTLAAVESATKSMDKRANVVQIVEEVVESAIAHRPEATVLKDVQGTPVAAVAPSQLRQILVNLVENALKYSDPPAHIRIAAAAQGAQVELRVEDQGQGIPPEDLPYIFDRFYRVDKSRGRREGGTGLGLSIVKEIVETYRGDIQVESKLGVGTTFTVILPAVGSDVQQG